MNSWELAQVAEDKAADNAASPKKATKKKARKPRAGASEKSKKTPDILGKSEFSEKNPKNAAIPAAASEKSGRVLSMNPAACRKRMQRSREATKKKFVASLPIITKNLTEKGFSPPQINRIMSLIYETPVHETIEVYDYYFAWSEEDDRGILLISDDPPHTGRYRGKEGREGGSSSFSQKKKKGRRGGIRRA